MRVSGGGVINRFKYRKKEGWKGRRDKEGEREKRDLKQECTPTGRTLTR